MRKRKHVFANGFFKVNICQKIANLIIFGAIDVSLKTKIFANTLILALWFAIQCKKKKKNSKSSQSTRKILKKMCYGISLMELILIGRF